MFSILCVQCNVPFFWFSCFNRIFLLFDVKRWWSIFFTVFHFHLFIWWWWWYDSEFCVILSFFLFLIVLQSKQHNSTHFENKMMTAKINDHLVVVVCLFFQSTEYPMNNHYSTNQNKNKTKSVLTKKYIVQNECFIHSFLLFFLHYKNKKQENHFNMTTYWVFFISKKNIVSYPIPIYTMMMMIVMKPKERKNRIEIILCFISMTIYIVVNINGDNNSILFFVYILGPNKKDAEMVQKRLNDVIFCFHFGYHNHHYHRFVWDVFFVFLLLCMFHLKN